jgi:adenylate cyclase
MSFASLARSARLFSGLVLMLFVAMHLANIALGVAGMHYVAAGHPWLSGLWSNTAGALLLLIAAIIHAVFGLLAVAQRRSLTLGRQDMVQLVLGLAVVPLLISHALNVGVAPALNQSIDGGYEVTLARYWVIFPGASIRQLAMVVIVWIHAAIGFVSWLSLRESWPRWRGLVLPVLFAIPILALLGFAEAGKDVLDRYEADAAFRESVAATVQGMGPVAPLLGHIESVVLGIYWICVAAALVSLGLRLRAGRRRPVNVRYEDGTVATGRFGLTILEISRANHVPHASVCSGRGRCGTCRVRVTAGREVIGPEDDVERKTLRGHDEGGAVRLACRARVFGRGVEVVRLMPFHADASAARDPEPWLAHAAAIQAGEPA